MMAAALPAIISAAGAIGGGYLAGKSQTPKETKVQRQSRKVADDLLRSIRGRGPYSNLFQTDENAFQKSFVEPAQARFRNQIAPQIQQQYIASGQQRGTGLDDQLLRAGIDLDQLLNENYYRFQQDSQNRMSNTLNNILGMGGVGGAPNQPSSMQSLGQATSGYLSSDAFSNLVKNIPGTGQQQSSNYGQNMNPYQQPTPRGYLPDWKVGDARWGY